MWKGKWNRVRKWLYDNVLHRHKVSSHERCEPELSDIGPSVWIEPIVLAEKKREIGSVRPAVSRPDTMSKRVIADLGDLETANEILNRHK